MLLKLIHTNSRYVKSAFKQKHRADVTFFHIQNLTFAHVQTKQQQHELAFLLCHRTQYFAPYWSFFIFTIKIYLTAKKCLKNDFKAFSQNVGKFHELIVVTNSDIQDKDIRKLKVVVQNDNNKSCASDTQQKKQCFSCNFLHAQK